MEASLRKSLFLVAVQTGVPNFKERHPRCVGKLDRWEGSQKHNVYNI